MRKASIVIILLIILPVPQLLAIDLGKVVEHLKNGDKFFAVSNKGEAWVLPFDQDLHCNYRFNMPIKGDYLLGDEMSREDLLKGLLSRWDSKNSKWVSISPLGQFAHFQSNCNFELNFGRKGFYKISGTKSFDKVLVVVSNDISKCLRKYLMEIKRYAERQPDPQLYKSTIFVSKVNGLLREKTTILNQKSCKKLYKTARDFQQLKKGECPELTPGLYKFFYKRFPGATVMEYVLRVPERDDLGIKFPFIYIPDSSRSEYRNNYGGFNNYVTLWCHNDSLKDYYWEEFSGIYDILCSKLSIDSNKSHIAGGCLNGISAIGIALQRPDFWASCVSSLGNSKRELAGNASNLYIRFSHVKNHIGNPEFDGWYTFAAKCFEYYNCSNADCNIEPVIINDDCIRDGLLKNDSPSYIQYRTDSLKRGKSYWISIDARMDEGLYAEIKAKVIDSTIYIHTENVESYSIRLSKAPVNGLNISIIESGRLPDANSDKGLVIHRRYNCNLPAGTVESHNSDGISAGITDKKVFKRHPDSYTDCDYLKTLQLSGGIYDVFTQPYVLVNQHMESSNNEYTEFSRRLAGDAQCYSDIEKAMKGSDSKNIIFVGSFEDYLKLPGTVKNLSLFDISENKVLAADKEYSGQLGIIAIYPNPLDSDRYFMAFICNSKLIAGKMPQVFKEINEMPEFDIGVFTLTEKGTVKWLVGEKLDATWNYHGDYADMLANVKSYKQWRWKAWRAEILRKQIGADVGLFENCFKQLNFIPEGEITKRDIHGHFQNTWIVKVEIKGHELREILSVPFEMETKRKILPVISGVSFVKLTKGSELYIGDIQDDEIYTLACPQKCLNGSRAGLSPKEYEIVDDGFAVEYILNYLSRDEVDLDEELAEQKLRIY